jgi:drug/metabolite transporter (DMT)-like permease
LLGAATVTAYYAAVEELPLSVAVAIFFFHPVLALLLNAAVSKSRVSPQAAGSCLLTVLGVLVIGWHDQLMLHLQQAAVFFGDLGKEGLQGAAAAAAAAGSDVILGPELSLYGVVMGLVAATANAAAFVVVGLIGREISPMSVCWWQYCVTTHAAVAVLLLSEIEAALVQASSAAAGAAGAGSSSALEGLGVSVPGVVGFAGAEGFVSSLQSSLQQSLQHLPPQHDLVLLSGVVVANFAGQLLLNAGFQRIDAGRGAAVNTLQVLYANAWDVLLLHSQPTAAILAGSGMIVAGVVGTRQSAEADDDEDLQQQQLLPQVVSTGDLESQQQQQR